VPLIGARRRDRLAEALAGLTLTLTANELASLEKAVPEMPPLDLVMLKPRWRILTANDDRTWCCAHTREYLVPVRRISDLECLFLHLLRRVHDDAGIGIGRFDTPIVFSEDTMHRWLMLSVVSGTSTPLLTVTLSVPLISAQIPKICVARPCPNGRLRFAMAPSICGVTLNTGVSRDRKNNDSPFARAPSKITE